MQWYFFQGQRSHDYLWHKLALGNFIVEFQVKELDENGRQNEVDESGQRMERQDSKGREGGSAIMKSCRHFRTRTLWEFFNFFTSYRTRNQAWHNKSSS